MSISIEKSSSLMKQFRDVLPSILTKARHSKIWGVDLNHGKEQLVELISEKFLKNQSANPALQVARASASLQNTLEWRSRMFADPMQFFNLAKPILSDLGICHITLCDAQYVLWVSIDETTIKGYSAIHPSLVNYSGLAELGLAVLERLSILLLEAATSSEFSASCVVEFKTNPVQNSRRRQESFHVTLRTALERLMINIRHHYPHILEKAYIINARDEYLASLDIDDALLRNTILLSNPEGLGQYLGSQIPPRFGGTGGSLAKSDLLLSHCFSIDPEVEPDIERSENIAAESTKMVKTGVNEKAAGSDINSDIDGLPTETQALRLIYSETIGPPSIILDPDELQTAEDLCPGKMGARVVFADSDMIAKFGHGVRLCEAEAMHLVSTRTNIALPRLLSAYVLDGVGYIIMSYEKGEPLENYWDRVTEAEHDRIIDQLRDYVNQMRDISGDFIGGLYESPCRDGIFEGGFGDKTRFSYGPYPSEASFNEGIIQALRDRLPPKVLEAEHNIESHFYNSEYALYKTVRGLRNHKILFTHGDLHAGNIVVRVDGTVVLLDWGLSGFWPEYWEFYRGMFSAPWRASWDRMVEKFIPPFYIEYHVMKRIFGTVLN